MANKKKSCEYETRKRENTVIILSFLWLKIFAHVFLYSFNLLNLIYYNNRFILSFLGVFFERKKNLSFPPIFCLNIFPKE